MPETARTEPTERSMPPVIITVTWPSAMMAMKAKFRVTLKKFSSFQKAALKVGSTSVMAIGIRKTAIVTQKACLAIIRCQTPGDFRAVADSLAISIKLRPLPDSFRHAARIAPVISPVTSSGELSWIGLSATLWPRRSTTIRSATVKTSGMRWLISTMAIP